MVPGVNTKLQIDETQVEEFVEIGHMVPIDPMLGTNLNIQLVKSDGLDLDASIVLINDIGIIQDAVYYNKLLSNDGSVSQSV